MESATTRLLATVASGAVGLAIGSFLNVVVYRLPRGMSLSAPPSHCPACDARIGPLDNVPVVSWLALRGRCRHCGAPISPRYPVIELATGLLFAGLALALPGLEPVAPLAAVAATTVAIVAIDLDGRDVPYPLGWVALGCSASLIAVSIATHAPGRLGWAGIGAGASVVAWALHAVVGRLREVGPRFPGLTSCAAWGGAAGWIAQGGGLAVGIGVALLALAGPLLHLANRRGVVALAGTMSVVTIVAGAIASR